MNLASWLHRVAASHPDLSALAHGTGQYASYRQFAAMAASIAGGLRRYGVKPGDRIAIASPNVPDYLPAIFGAWWGGCSVVPINAGLHPQEKTWIFGHADVSIVFCDAKTANGLSGQLSQPVIPFGSPAFAALLSHDPVPLQLLPDHAMAWLFYTSGTTGRPKGAMLSHGNLASMVFGFLTSVDVTLPGDSLLHAAPLSHGSGLYALAAVMRGAVNVIPESSGFAPDEVSVLSCHHRRMSFFAAPTMVKRLVAYADDLAPRDLRTIIYGGAPMLVADTQAAAGRFPGKLAQIYGQGETPMTASVLGKELIADYRHPDWLRRLASAGTANPVVDLAILSGDGNRLPDGESGEVAVRGPSVMLGYWKDEAATASAFSGGWLKTGDIGYMDGNGYLYLQDRSKDVVISGGTNIYPREVEEVLLTHPQVDEVSVIGRPDPDWGEAVVAYFVGRADPADLDRWCLDQIARFKRPKAYIRVPALPKNNYGKILKSELRRLDTQSLAS